ncbi:polysaccharide biosynthesis protein, partial [Enterobacter kobei]|uniref:polysaccharide biosynthesis protein n=3 Tax=Enterobacter TaxID=547 RepID=UPI0006652AE9
STARFANVAFSDGSLLHGFNQRIQKRQPIVAPNDIKRYFVTPQESGELCLMSCIFGERGDIFFPKLSEELDLITFSEIAVLYLQQLGLKPYLCNSEEEAREFAKSNLNKDLWPCLFTPSDTTGEKDFEEFFMANEIVDMYKYDNIGIVKNTSSPDSEKIQNFRDKIQSMKKDLSWNKDEIVSLFHETIGGFGHQEKGKYLDGKM